MFSFSSLTTLLEGETVKLETISAAATVDESGTWFSSTTPEIGIFWVIVNISVTICESLLVEGVLSTKMYPCC